MTETQKPTKPSTDIIWETASKELGPNANKNVFFAKLGRILKNPKNKLLQVGQSVFLIINKGPGIVEFHTFSQESPEQLAKNYVAAAKAVKSVGAKKAYSFSPDGRFNKIAELTGLPVKVEQSQMMMGGKMVPAYRFEVDL